MPAHKIGDLLLQSGELRALSRRTHQLAGLQRAVLEAIPGPLSSVARVKSLRSGTLFIAADNAAAAAKLRQLSPRLLEHLRKLGAQVTGIRVEVQVTMPQMKPGKTSRKQPLKSRTLADFQKLARGLKDSPLRDAVTRLVQRHKRGAE
ncbi:MAG: DciA family protein [Burkholderiales bacterium]